MLKKRLFLGVAETIVCLLFVVVLILFIVFLILKSRHFMIAPILITKKLPSVKAFLVTVFFFSRL